MHVEELSKSPWASTLALDLATAASSIERQIARHVALLRRRGAVVALSGGVDSALVAGLCARALGPEAVLALFLHGPDTPSDARGLVFRIAETFGIRIVVEEIASALDGLRSRERQLDAVRSVVPEFGEGWRIEVGAVSVVDDVAASRVLVASPDGEWRSARLAPDVYRQLAAAAAFEQRARKIVEYYHSDRLGYAVAGTANRLEHDLGIFAKQGNGAADFKPIAHLYKTQVYALAAHVGVPDEVRARLPSVPTFSIAPSEGGPRIAVPFWLMDAALHGYNAGLDARDVAASCDVSPGLVGRLYHEIEAKRRATRYLRVPTLIPDAPGEG